MGEAEPGVLGGSGCVSRAHRGASVYMQQMLGPSPERLNKQTNKRGGTCYNTVESEGGRTRGTEEKRRRVFDSDPVLIPIRLDRSCQKLIRPVINIL